MMRKNLIIYSAILMLCACGGSTSTSEAAIPAGNGTSEPIKSTDNLPIPNNRELSNYNILIIGNSHVAGIESLLTEIFSHGDANKTVNIDTRNGAFLDTIVNNESIIETIQNKQWTHVILQGQKYSQSQSEFYPIDATVTWIQRAKAIGATPILFPEHPLAGKPQDAIYVHGIHVDIAKEQHSCVAPVGLAWNQAFEISPELTIHQADGNHATMLGKLLSSLVLYETITGKSADLLTFSDTLPGDAITQALFGQVASQAIIDNIPCNF
ncbi:MAG: hypothetical protein ACJAVX_000836 [Pseudoalteromonas rhizosphaerae]|jgi:hypothetical protein|uniref:SGNH/GDSL hydrolase family protein n=1 Tax=Pseudoalteromonas neustonica TaxID=1840331 RepID=A0ABY3FIN2_9GAMM|nr:MULTISPECIES: hypothetical protein [Pseudoalteromonas]MBB1300133.1 hypothetical protein [Pseudoalteromonas sp. SR44-8]MBB1407875.1 hypothetical protein [Pseudoalteromonas sp. SG44-17]MBB1504198.1 hypothetical protein [Pseudoalteromonas sp. SG41-1]TVU85553.1 hypothetical protein FQP85_04315 [Pseudoalteromonas neustonica]